MSNTSNLDLERPDRGASAWDTSLNSNFTKLDTGYGNNVATIADLPEVYIETETFNGTSGVTITLPKSVDAVNEYNVCITTTARTAGIGDIFVEKTTSNFVVKNSQNNSTDTFSATIYYIGDIASYGGSIYRRWYVSTDSGITDHGDDTDTGSFAWVLDQIGASPATVELPGNKTYTITTTTSVSDNVNIILQKGAVFGGAGILTFDSPEQLLCSQRQEIFGSSITIAFTNKGTVSANWWGAVGDGTTDDEPAINAALVASTGGICKLLASPNEYIVGAPIVVSERNRLIGESSANDTGTIIKLDDNVDDNVIESGTWTAQSGYSHWFEIAHIKIDGNKANNASTSAGIAIYGMGETSEIHHVFIENCNDYGIRLSGIGAPARLRNVTIHDSGVAAIFSDQTGAAVTTFDSFSGDDNQIYFKFEGTCSALILDPKMEGDHDPAFDLQFTASGGNYSMVTVVGGYANGLSTRTDLISIDGSGGASASIALINFRQAYYTNIIDDIDAGETYTISDQSLEGIYMFNSDIKLYGADSKIFLPFNTPISSEDGLNGTEYELLKQTGSGLRIQDATGGGFKIREAGMSSAETLIRHKTTEITCNGATETWVGALSGGTITLGVTARVITLITGATSLDVGISGGDTDLFIDGMDVALDTTADIANSNAAFASPLINQSGKDILVTAQGGSFTAGVLRIVVHYIDLTASTS